MIARLKKRWDRMESNRNELKFKGQHTLPFLLEQILGYLTNAVPWTRTKPG
jgi:hypothetical protein